MMLRLWPGNAVRVDVDFVGVAGEPMAALGVSITAKPPNASVIEGTVIAEQGTGSFYAIFPVTTSGIWAVRAVCTGPTPVAIEDRFEVAKSYVI